MVHAVISVLWDAEVEELQVWAQPLQLSDLARLYLRVTKPNQGGQCKCPEFIPQYYKNWNKKTNTKTLMGIWILGLLSQAVWVYSLCDLAGWMQSLTAKLCGCACPCDLWSSEGGPTHLYGNVQGCPCTLERKWTILFIHWQKPFLNFAEVKLKQRALSCHCSSLYTLALCARCFLILYWNHRALNASRPILGSWVGASTAGEGIESIRFPHAKVNEEISVDFSMKCILAISILETTKVNSQQNFDSTTNYWML